MLLPGDNVFRPRTGGVQSNKTKNALDTSQPTLWGIFSWFERAIDLSNDFTRIVGSPLNTACTTGETAMPGPALLTGMTRVCLVGDRDVNLQYELLSRETARDALAAYDLREPFHNSVAVETVSLGAAVALLNDLDWYLVRFVSVSFVLEPSVSEDEWLSRDLATAIRDERVDPAESGRFLAVYGLERPDEGPPRPVEPMFVTRTGETIPDYDLRDVDETLVVRVTEDEFGA